MPDARPLAPSNSLGWTKTPNSWLEESAAAGVFLPAAHRAVLDYLLRATLGWHAKAVDAPQTALAEASGYSTRTVRRALADLERWRILRRPVSGPGRVGRIELLDPAGWRVTETTLALEGRQRRRFARGADQLALPLPGTAEVLDLATPSRVKQAVEPAAYGRFPEAPQPSGSSKKKEPRGRPRRGSLRPRSRSRSGEEGAMPNGPRIFGGEVGRKARSTDYRPPESKPFSEEDRLLARRRRAAREALRERGFAGSVAAREAEIDRIAADLSAEDVERLVASADARVAAERDRRRSEATLEASTKEPA